MIGKLAYIVAVALYLASWIASLGLLVAVFVSEGLHGRFAFDPEFLFVVPNLVVMSWPSYLIFARWRYRQRGVDFLPAEFRASMRTGYIWGMAFILLGHVGFVGSVVLIVSFALGPLGEMAPFGIGLAWSLITYVVGILCVEVSMRGWEANNVR